MTKATVAAWCVAPEARGLGAVSINVRITAVWNLAVEAADNGLLAPELANGITWRKRRGLQVRAPGQLADGDRPGRHADPFTCMVSIFRPQRHERLYSWRMQRVT